MDPRLPDALEELDSYLADNLPPLLVADSVEVLLDFPPEMTAEVLRAWTASQFQARGGELPISDLFFHALKKLQLLEELHLLPEERFAAFLVEVAGRLVAACPPGDRARLTASLRFLTETRGPRIASIDRLHRAVGDAAATAQPSGAAAPQLSAEELRGLRRFSLMMERALPARGASSAGGPPRDVASQLLVLAAAEAASAHDLESRVARLQESGVGPAVSRDLVAALAESIPDWVVRHEQSIEAYRGGSVEAVRRVVQLAGDRARTSERWKDLLRAAADHFNRGAYGRSVTLIDLADRMARAGEVEARVAEIARGSGHEAFDVAALLQATSDPQNRAMLRRLVEFFPAWSVHQLLDDLFCQPDPKRRRLVLALVEVWGAEAREPVFERLGTSIAGGSRDPDAWWFLRNLIYLLHRLPRLAQANVRRELELVAPFSALGQPPSFQRETFILLGGLPGGIGAQVLVQRLREAERALEGTAAPPREVQETWKLLNALAAALARCGAPAARRALVEHALAARPRTGDAAARLRELAWSDLSGEPELVERLLDALRSLLPVKVLGFVVSRNEETLSHVVRALSATTDPAVRSALAEVAERFPDKEFGRLAAGGALEEARPEPVHDLETVEEPPRPAAARASLAGDLEVFGLPGLLQSLQQSEASGRLMLRDPSGRERAVFELATGGLVDCRCGRLSGEVAFYQVFELSAPGTFEFTRASAAPPAGKPRFDLLVLLLEGMRRYDELARARALVPDEARLRAGSGRPSVPPGETDGELIRELWTRVRSGVSAAMCEAGVEVDSFRVRAILVHWLEEGTISLEAGREDSGSG